MSAPLVLRKFEAGDLDEYASWFVDEHLYQTLGPTPDAVWLEHILNDGEGSQLSVFLDEELIAVVGILHHIPSHPFQTVTDIAIKPSLWRQGLGTQVLRATVEYFELDWAIDWQCFVDQDNVSALGFFESNGWECYKHPDSDGMIRCTWGG